MLNAYDLRQLSLTIFFLIAGTAAIISQDLNMILNVAFLPQVLLFVPQFYKTFVKKEYEGLSFKSMSILVISSSLFLLSGMLIPEWHMVVLNTIDLAFVFAICWILNKTKSIQIAMLSAVLFSAGYGLYTMGLSINYFLLVCGGISCIGILQQAYTSLRTKNTKGVSYSTFFFMFFLYALWFVWSLKMDMWGATITTFIASAASFIICIIKLRNWREDHPVHMTN